MNIQRIAHSWNLYANSVEMPRGGIQEAECRMAFFAGASFIFDLFVGISEPIISEEEGVPRLEGVRREIDAYVADFKRKHGLGEEPKR